MKKDIATVLIIGNTTETGAAPAELFHGQIPEIVEKDHDVIGWGGISTEKEPSIILNIRDSIL